MQLDWDFIQYCEIIDWKKDTNWFIKTLNALPNDEKNYYREDGSIIFNLKHQGSPVGNCVPTAEGQ